MRCIHCLRESETTDDHILPASWYPESTPATIQHLTAPSCRPCNANFGKLEEDLRLRLMGCIDPESDAAAGIHEKTLRSLGIGVGELGEHEKGFRERRRQRIISEFIPVSEVSEMPGRIPGLGPGMDKAGQSVMPIPMAALSMLAEKIARGCEYNYKKQQRFIELPYGLRTFVSSGDVPEAFLAASTIIDLGPGCRITRVFATEDPYVVLYWITIWNSLHMHVRIDKEDYLKSIQFPKFEGISLPEGKAGMAVPNYLRNFT